MAFMIIRKKILTSVVMLALVTSLSGLGVCASASAKPGNPTEFIADLGDRAIRTLADTSVGDASRRMQFRALFLEGFDVKTLGIYAIGRYWRKANKDQRSEYLSLFTDFIVNTYANRFGQYSGEKLDVTGERAVKGRDTFVQSQIVRPKGAPVRVDWRVRLRKSGFKVIDIVVEGVSMAITQREEFASVIRRHGGKIDGLISELKRKTE
jgi:phospholipid transport system substrate-binding protein